MIIEVRGRGAEEHFLLPSRSTDCTPMESSKSIKTIFFRWVTAAFLADCREQGPGKVRKSIMCVHLCFSLKQTPAAPSEQRGLAGISLSIWQARLITALLYNATHVATHRCWLSLFPYAGKCTGHGRERGRERGRGTPQ